MTDVIEKINIGQQVLANSDGLSWTQAVENTNLGNHNWHCIAYGNGVFVAVSYQGSYLSTSTDGINWSVAEQCPELDRSSGYWWVDIVFDGTKFIVVDMSGYTSTSTDGTNWTTPVSSISSMALSNCQKVCYGSGIFLALGQTGYYSTSNDGTTWTTATQDANITLSGSYWRGLAFGRGKFVALGSNGEVASYTSNGQEALQWKPYTQSANLGSHTWNGIIYHNDRFIAVSLDGYVSTSIDGETWTEATENTNLGNNGWYDIIDVNNKLYIIGFHGYLSTSYLTTNNIPIGGDNFDGNTHYIHTIDLYSSTLTANQIVPFDISKYLPDNIYTYEVLVDGQINTGTSSGNAAGIQVASGKKTTSDNTFYYLGRCNTRSSSNHGIFYCGWVEIKPNDQYFTIKNYDASGTSGTCYIHLKAYRRIGYNNDNNTYLANINDIPIGGKSHKGQWQNVQWHIIDSSFASKETKTVDLATYGIPDDDYTYRVIVSMYSVTPATSGRACKFSVCPSHASYVQVLMVITRSGSNEIGRNTVQVDLLPHDRTLAIFNGADTTTGSTIVNITGYRRLGNNE